MNSQQLWLQCGLTRDPDTKAHTEAAGLSFIQGANRPTIPRRRESSSAQKEFGFCRVLVVELECGRKALRTKGAVSGREDFSKQSFMGAEGPVGGGSVEGMGWNSDYSDSRRLWASSAETGVNRLLRIAECLVSISLKRLGPTWVIHLSVPGDSVLGQKSDPIQQLPAEDGQRRKPVNIPVRMGEGSTRPHP